MSTPRPTGRTGDDAVGGLVAGAARPRCRRFRGRRHRAHLGRWSRLVGLTLLACLLGACAASDLPADPPEAMAATASDRGAVPDARPDDSDDPLDPSDRRPSGPGSMAPRVGANGSDGSIAQDDADPDTMATQVADPIAVSIPVLDVVADVLALDLRTDGTIEVPPDHADAGWYRHGARSGEPGATVLGAHVDWDGVPGVFRDIDALRPGDTVEVTDADGRRTTYAVERVEQHRKDAFPTFDVYGDTAQDTLRLVTCGGPFLTEQRSHRDNIVVFATAVD